MGVLSRSHSAGVQKKPHRGREASKAAGQKWGGRKGVLMCGIRDVFGMMQREQQRVLELKE